MKRTYLRDGRAPIPKDEKTSRIMSSIRAKNTKPEIALRKALWKNGLSGYRLHWEKVPGKPDIAYPKKKLAIFVNGCYWHRCPHCHPSFPKTHIRFWKNKFNNNQERDARKTKELQYLGWRVITLWECEVRTSLQDCITRINLLVYK